MTINKHEEAVEIVFQLNGQLYKTYPTEDIGYIAQLNLILSTFAMQLG